MTEFGQGLTLSGIGLLTTFAALILLILVIIALKILFPAAGSDEGEESPRARTSGENIPGDRDQLHKRAAAAAAAVLLTREGSLGSQLGKILESPRGSWWHRTLERIHRKE